MHEAVTGWRSRWAAPPSPQRVGGSVTGTSGQKGCPMPELRTLMSGLVFGEQPRWHEGRLWFSDWGRQLVIAVETDGDSESSSAGRPSRCASTGRQTATCW